MQIINEEISIKQSNESLDIVSSNEVNLERIKPEDNTNIDRNTNNEDSGLNYNNTKNVNPMEFNYVHKASDELSETDFNE